MTGSPNFITINFPSQITKIESEIFPGGEITSSSRQSNTAADGDIYTLTCTVENGYKISNCVYSNAGNAELRGFTDTTITLGAGTGGLGGTLDISVAQVAQKAISLSNLEKFKELCDQTYAKTGGSGGGGGGGTQLYDHNITYGDNSVHIITNSETAVTTGAQLRNLIQSQPFCVVKSGIYSCMVSINRTSPQVIFYRIEDGNIVKYFGVTIDSTTVTDIVTPL